MAGSKEIKQKIVLEGEKEYSQAIKDANRNLRVLKSELKAETAELGKNASEQDKAALKAKNLKAQIAEQEKIVQTLTEELQQVREKYGDNADAVAQWETKLNNARATLGNLKSELTETGQGLKGVGDGANSSVVATRSLAESLGQLSDIGGGLADTLQGAFEGVVGALKNTITTIWGDIIDLAAKSNNIVDLAGYWNTDVNTIQKYKGAVAEASASLEDLNALVTKINSGDNEKIAELTGVSNVGYEDQWKYAMAVMDAMSKMDTLQRNSAGFQIFGKGATKMFDMANDWQTVLDNLDKYDPTKGGFGLSEEQYNQMSSLYDKVNGLRASWEALQGMAMVHLFGDLSIDLTGNAQGILDGILEYFNAEDQSGKDAAIGKIAGEITEAFEGIRKAILDGVDLLDGVAEDLKKSNNPTAQALGTIMGGLADALQWFTEDNANNAVHALEILAKFWIAGKGLQMIAKTAELAANLKTIQRFFFGGAAASGAASGTAGSTSGGGLLGWIGQTGIGKALGSLFSGASGNLIGAGVMGAMVAGDKTAAGRTIRDGGTIGEAVEAGKEEITDYAGQVRKNAEDWWSTAREVLGLENAERFWNKFYFGNEEGPKEGEAGGLTGAIEDFGSWLLSLGNSAGGDVEPGKNGETNAALTEEGPAIVAVLREIEGIVEDVDLTEDYSDTDKDAAVQDWWDAWKNADQGLDTYEEEQNAFDYMAEVFGDEFGEVVDAIMRNLDEIQNQHSLEDIPSSWWQNAGYNNGNVLQTEDLRGFRSLPGMIAAAVESAAASGTAEGVSGISITLDGYAVGRAVAPYVSQSMARGLIV